MKKVISMFTVHGIFDGALYGFPSFFGGETG